MLIVEDSEDDAELLVLELMRSGFEVTHMRVQDATGLRAALRESSWDAVLSDHSMPGFDAFAALDLVREECSDLPFIVVSGMIGEDVAVEIMRAGANDYLLKDRLNRLAPAIERELVEVDSRRQRRRAEEQLREAQKLESLGQLTGGVAHDFNNLLGSILGHAEIVGKRFEGENRSVQAIIRAVERGAELTERLLSFSRRQPLNSRAVDLRDLLGDVLPLMYRTLGETIAIDADLDPAVWPAVVDPGQLENALLNLAINARDAMPDGGTLLFEAENVSLGASDVLNRADLAPGEYVSLSVKDTGEGMPPEVVKRAFEPFFTTKEVGQGTGLGLSMVHGFAKQSGGDATITSDPGSGTTVTILLPRATGPVDRPEPAAEPPAPTGGDETVLVVEDEPDVLTTIEAILSSLGYRVLSAKNARAGLEIMESAPAIDLIFCDVVLPGGVSGPEMIERVRAVTPDAKVLFMSAHADPSIALGIPLPEGSELMHKPFRTKELARRVRKALDG